MLNKIVMFFVVVGSGFGWVGFFALLCFVVLCYKMDIMIPIW